MILIQPNGKICSVEFNSIVYNLTEQEYIEHEKQKAAAVALEKSKNPHTIGDVLKYRRITDDQLKEMGYEKTYDEMMKYIPKRVEEYHYVDRDCTTYGKCPTCGSPVQDGIGMTDNKCRKCEQVLKWGW